MIWEIDDAGELVRLRSRAELATPENQNRLARAWARDRHFRCLCTPEQLRLFPVETPNGRGWTLRCAKNENTRHAKHCPARVELEEDTDGAERPTVLYSSSILLPPNPEAQQQERGAVILGAADERVRSTSSQRYGNLTQLTQSLLEIATMRAFRAANHALATYRDCDLQNPSTSEIYQELQLQLDEPVFTDGRSPFAAAAAAGLRIAWGVTDHPLADRMANLGPDDDALGFLVTDFWSAHGRVHRVCEFTIPRRTAQCVGGKLTAHGRLIQPPYFFLLTADRNNVVARLVLLPVASAADTLCVIESDPERGLCGSLLREGVAFLKPNVLADLTHLGPRLWPLPTVRNQGRLARRPDLLIFCRGITVAQLLGSDKSNYLGDVAAAMSALREHLVHPDITFAEILLGEISGPSFPALVARLRRGVKPAQESAPATAD